MVVERHKRHEKPRTDRGGKVFENILLSNTGCAQQRLIELAPRLQFRVEVDALAEALAETAAAGPSLPAKKCVRGADWSLSGRLEQGGRTSRCSVGS